MSPLSKFVVVIVVVPVVILGILALQGDVDEKPIPQVATNNQQDEIDALREQIEEIKKNSVTVPQTITKYITTKETPLDLSMLIKKWRPRIAYIECEWYSKKGELLSSASGSGVLIPRTITGDYVIITNKHVIHDINDYIPLLCYVDFPDSNDTYTLEADLNTMSFNQLSSDPDFDYGNIIVNQLTAYRKTVAGTFNSSSYSACKNKASVGDQVVILGYPSVGSSMDITATEGIISGYENGHYVTSAKVEHGNSGGAAILVKDDCYLGIPTFVVTGELESLARILDLNYLSDVWSR